MFIVLSSTIMVLSADVAAADHMWGIKSKIDEKLA
jgi:hypothetical protein